VWKWALAWKKELLQNECQQAEELMSLLAGHKPSPSHEDVVQWKGKGQFTAKDFQQLVHMEMDTEVDCVVCSVWMNIAPPKVELFLWLALLGKLNTKEMLCRKGILQQSQNVCTFCSTQPEDLDHLLVNCTISWGVWCTIASEFGKDLSRKASFRELYESWLEVKWQHKKIKKIWISIFFAVAWSLWLWRNQITFNQKELVLSEVCLSIKWLVAQWTRAWKDKIPYKVEEIARNFASIPVIFQ